VETTRTSGSKIDSESFRLLEAFFVGILCGRFAVFTKRIHLTRCVIEINDIARQDRVNSRRTALLCRKIVNLQETRWLFRICLVVVHSMNSREGRSAVSVSVVKPDDKLPKVAVMIKLDYSLWQAAELLDKLMAGADPPDEPIYIEPKELVPRQSTDVTAVDDAEVSAAMRLIAEHCSDPIQVQDVADAIALSRRTLQRRFQAKLGRSISDQIEFLRLQ